MTAAPGRRIGWLDCSSGVSGDMLLGALHELTGLGDLSAVLASTPDLGARIEVRTVDRAGLRATHADVVVNDDVQPPRRLADVLALIERVPVAAHVADRARRVFERLAAAEGAVHGIDPTDVHFHEVGAVDAIVDVVGVCWAFDRLALDRLVVSPVALGSGTARAVHGELPVPAPAVLELLAGTSLQVLGSSSPHELATPTGVALLAELADETGGMPAMTVTRVGTGAGRRDPVERANVVRLVVGEAAPDEETGWLLLEANIDDLDPRLWPAVIDALLGAGAADAWVTPILMKKGRPAHTLAALAPAEIAASVRTAMFLESSTIGVRSSRVDKHALERSSIRVDVDGQPIRVKVARLDGAVVNTSPEWEDVAAAARALGRPAKAVLNAAVSAAQSAL